MNNEIKVGIIQDVAMEIELDNPGLTSRELITKTVKELMLQEWPFDLNRVVVARAINMR